MADSAIHIAGSLGADPELRYTTSGRAVCSFNMAVSRRYQVNNEWQEQTSWMRVVAWGTLAENAAASLTKGSRAVVIGRIEQRSWETDEGDKRSIIEVVADDIGAALKWATVQITKNERTTAGRTANPDDEVPPHDDAPRGGQSGGRGTDPIYGDEEPF